jgi:hypothetical protein
MILHELDDLLLRIPGFTCQDDLPVLQDRNQKLDHLGGRLDPGLLSWLTSFVPALIEPLPAWHSHPESTRDRNVGYISLALNDTRDVDRNRHDKDHKTMTKDIVFAIIVCIIIQISII